MTSSTRSRLTKRAIQAPAALNEATEYERPIAFSRGIRVELGSASMILISGTAAVDQGGASLHPGDVYAQTMRAFENIKALLEAEDADWHDVVRTTCYLADMRDYERFNQARDAFYAAEKLDPLPASTCVEARICRPELLVEIEAMAVIPVDR